MRLTKKINKAHISFLLTLLLLLQTIGTSFAISSAAPSTIETPSNAGLAAYTQIDHGTEHCGNSDATSGGDLHSLDGCALACCPVITSKGAPGTESNKTVLPLEFIVSYTPVTLPIEVKPPRIVAVI